MDKNDVLEFSKGYAPIFGAEAIKDVIRLPDTRSLRLSQFNSYYELVNYNDNDITVQGFISREPKDSEYNFLPYKSLYKARQTPYVGK